MMEQIAASSTPLIDKIYQMLCTEEERAYSHGYHNPKFQIYLSPQQRDQVRLEALTLSRSSCFMVDPANMDEILFGCKVIVVYDTPYVRLVGEMEVLDGTN